MERKTAFIYTGGTVFDEYVIEKPEKGDLVIAADAGYLTAKKMGVTPDILLGDFDTLGVGVYKGGSYGIYWTQLFTGGS